MEQSVQQHGAVQEQLKEKYPIQRSPYLLAEKWQQFMQPPNNRGKVEARSKHRLKSPTPRPSPKRHFLAPH